MDHTPLCSIGVPTYNRPSLLARALDEIRNQTYRNLEIIVSDNASPDPEVEALCRRVAAEDSRVRYFRQCENIGASANFEFVFREATAEFFMWAADDDRRSATYVETLVAAMQSRPMAALCAMEACYETDDGVAAFFPQYAEIYHGIGSNRKERILKVIAHLGTANITYGLFRRRALFHGEIPAVRWIGPTLNEHPLFVLVADKGDVVCLPQVGLWKRATPETVAFASWHAGGGFRWRRPSLRRLKTIYRYHRAATGEIDAALDALDLPTADITEMKRRQRRELARHAVYFFIGWKPRL